MYCILNCHSIDLPKFIAFTFAGGIVSIIADKVIDVLYKSS
jgi:hypothetical protein